MEMGVPFITEMGFLSLFSLGNTSPTLFFLIMHIFLLGIFFFFQSPICVSINIEDIKV